MDFQLKKWAASTDSSIDDVLAPLFGKTLRVFIIIIGGILIIQNLTGVKIGPLLASLGIGGIAIALAAKDSIANFFGTLTILFDKPFQVGERILIDNYDGVVEDVPRRLFSCCCIGRDQCRWALRQITSIFFGAMVFSHQQALPGSGGGGCWLACIILL